MQVTMQHAERLTLAGMREFLAASDTLSFAGAGRKQIYAMVGQLREISRRKYVSSHLPAKIYAALGEKDEAFAALDLASFPKQTNRYGRARRPSLVHARKARLPFRTLPRLPCIARFARRPSLDKGARAKSSGEGRSFFHTARSPWSWVRARWPLGKTR